MEIMPKSMKIGCALGAIGGIISIICLVLFFEADESTILVMGVYMLLAVLFFAQTGAYTRNGQWPWDVLALVTFLTIGVVFAAMIFEVVEREPGILLIIIEALMIMALTRPSAKIWLSRIKV
jgi:hypothetical protein